MLLTELLVSNAEKIKLLRPTQLEQKLKNAVLMNMLPEKQPLLRRELSALKEEKNGKPLKRNVLKTMRLLLPLKELLV